MSEVITYPRQTFIRQTEQSILTVTEQKPGIFTYEISNNLIDLSSKSYASTKDAIKHCIKAYQARLLNELASLKENFSEVLS